MRHQRLLVFFIGILVLVLVGCGRTNQTTVMQNLQQLRGNLPSYQTNATMTVHTSPTSAQTYLVETRYQSPTAYKIVLSNSNHQINQIVIRNAEGLFIVSPQAKKAFRFQGEWAESQGQAYLYHILLDNLLRAKDIRYSVQKDGTFSFNLPVASVSPWVARQNVILDSKTLFPKQLQYLDKDGKIVVDVLYTGFKTGVQFAENEFQTQSALVSAQSDLPALAIPHGEFGIEPGFLPEGVVKLDEQKKSDQVWIRYRTEHGMMTLQEINQNPHPLSSIDPNGKVYDLFAMPAVASTNAAGTILQWTNEGVEYTLIGDLPLPTLWRIAESMIH